MSCRWALICATSVLMQDLTHSSTDLDLQISPCKETFVRKIANHTAVVTGASRGIGPYIARALAREKMNVALVARSPGPLEEVAAELEGLGVRALAVPADLTRREDLEVLVERVTGELGGIDVLVNNAGIEVRGPYHTTTPEEIEQVLQANLTAPMLLTRLVLPGMLERGRGHIVNIASLAGKMGLPYFGVYSASKAGLIGFTRALRAEYRESGIGASAILLGYVREAGVYQRTVEETGVGVPKLMTSSPEAVARAVLRALRRDLPEVVVAPAPAAMRMTTALQELFPSFAAGILQRSGTTEVIRKTVRAKESSGGAPD